MEELEEHQNGLQLWFFIFIFRTFDIMLGKKVL